MLKNILIGLSLIGVSGVGGYFIARKVLEAEYQADIAEIKKMYQDKLEELDAMIAALEGAVPPSKEELAAETPEERDTRETLASYRGQRRRSVIEYNKPSLSSFKEAQEELHRYSEGVSVTVDPNGDEHLGEMSDDGEDEEYDPTEPQDEDELDAEAEEYARRRAENMQSNRPYVIEAEEYREGPEEYEHQVLYYYAEDRTLCEDNDTKVEDEEEIVGFDYEDKLDMQTTCWVRNDTLQVLYEIHRIDDSYKKAVQNVSETPREREFRVQGRRKGALDAK